ncbi:MAG TPA: SGNH/GDSL hydrolase family protein [Gordonia sp. (in: high G+C Gram-positive bacteria)]|uniref:SGNH/GDSL hydrolase family protein n=1 Tax=unclassified Gordonia (in: high G+C Gram-positive bacteria) TaxID=2657482 RepID=UPI0025BB0C0D|nr:MULTISPECIES: SGNH/GDSL hydrolase family protein [unclassified Gordonia (in: high G+C Gram-positive bacteria)]HNP55730.1 SGNH/GDSL hydrolase family protein [Gordonia sp. (in: high G+C Gram-positive bacteria)]HRC49466.1 SGNH/GDSL hydrolase family protein [Gordonia sp. (in: high G+C Gram-positive bacteria)]
MPSANPDEKADRILRDVEATVVAAGASAAASYAAYRYLNSQAAHARRIIPRRTDSPPNGDGVYYPDGRGPVPYSREIDVDLHLAMYGDSTAAGLGVDTAEETPGVQIVRNLVRETGKAVRYSNKAMVGATSKGLAAQIHASLITRSRPDVAVILVGGNDVTAVNRIRLSARRLGDAVQLLVDAGSKVVVGTCPDLGVVTAIPQPLRWVIRQYSLRLAAAQRSAVRAHGGRAVPMADVLAKEFLARPEHMFSPDNYHPSAAGYALAASILLPEVLDAVGEWGGPLPTPPEVSEAVESRRLINRIRRLLPSPAAH